MMSLADRVLQGPRAVHGVESGSGDFSQGRFRYIDLHLHRRQALGQVLQLNLGNGFDIGLVQGVALSSPRSN